MRQLRYKKLLENLCFAHILICLLYVLSLCFVFSAAVTKVGLHLATPSACQGAIFLCLTFYILSKVVM